MMPENVRFKVADLIRELNETSHLCKDAMIQAPGADRFSLGIIGAVSDFAATHSQSVLDHQPDQTTLDATLPELTPDLSKSLGERMRPRREALARQEVKRSYRLH